MNDREKEVFRIIMKHYLESGETVGSRTLEKKYNMGLSSATIRNVMSDLEDMGFITKMHTSSGRMPTLDGYKIYIDELLQIEDPELELKEKIFSTYKNRINKSETIFYESVKLLSEVSDSMAIILEPSIKTEMIKKINFIRITTKDVFVVVVMNNNIIKTCMLTMNTYVNDENINILNEYMQSLIEKNDKKFMLKDLERFLKTIGKTDFNYEDKKIFENNKVYIEGKDKILFKSMQDINKAVEILKIVNDDTEIKNIFKKLSENYVNDKVSVVFAKELGYKELEDYVFIYGFYEFGDKRGIIGIMNQARVDYSKVVSIIELIISVLKRMLNQNVENLYLGYMD